jgi:hypothetical protein
LDAEFAAAIKQMRTMPGHFRKNREKPLQECLEGNLVRPGGFELPT